MSNHREPWRLGTKTKDRHTIYSKDDKPVVDARCAIVLGKPSCAATIHHAERIIDCVNALSGLNPEALAGLIDAVNSAIASLEIMDTDHAREVGGQLSRAMDRFYGEES